MTSTPLPPPGWHVDPQDPSQWRYWDGQQWTEHRAPRDAAASPSTPLPATHKGKGAMRADFTQLATAAAHGDQAALGQLPGAAAAAKGSYRRSKWLEQTVTAVAETILDIAADDLITAEEERDWTASWLPSRSPQPT